MPSMLHEGLLLLFRNRPTLAPELLQGPLGVKLPPFTEARVESAELTEVVPAQYQADLVVLLLDGQPVLAIVVEVQLARDNRKRETWPVYLTSLRARLRCPALLLVAAPDEAVADWARQPIETGHPGFALRPIVIGPNAVPMVTNAEEVARAPELAVLSAMAHGEDPSNLTITKVLNAAVPGLEEERAGLYLDLVVFSLRGATRAAFEAMMQTNYEYQSDFARKYYKEGIEEGIEKGRLAGEVSTLLDVLDSRGIAVDAEARARIEGCKDSVQLRVWVRRAVTVKAVAELFEAERKTSKPARAKRKR